MKGRGTETKTGWRATPFVYGKKWRPGGKPPAEGAGETAERHPEARLRLASPPRGETGNRRGVTSQASNRSGGGVERHARERIVNRVPGRSEVASHLDVSR